MAETQSGVVLNIGSQRVTMGVFTPTKGSKLTLRNYESVDLLADPAAEAGRMAQLKGAVKQLAKELKIKKGAEVRCAVPSHSVITKFVKLPPIESDGLDDLVTLEAGQQIPFPLEEGVWDWAEVPGAGIEKEVVIVAIKRDVLDEYHEALVANGFVASSVDSAPTALFNAFKYAYADEDVPTLLIDVGAKTTDLLYAEGGRFFARNVNVAGVSLTKEIAKEYDVSFAEAEGHKVGGGMVSMGQTEGLDESQAALAATIRQAIGRLPAEIKRTTSYYRSQQGGEAPAKAYLAGGGAALPYLAEFLEEELQIPVELFNPFRRVTAGSKLDSETLGAEAPMLGEIVGLGVHDTGKAALEIDLVPSVVEQMRDAQRRKPWLIGAASLLLLGGAGWVGAQYYAAEETAAAAEDLEEQVEAVEPYDRALGQYAKVERDLTSKGQIYAQAQLSRVEMARLLDEVNSLFASEYLWVTSLAPLSNYTAGGGAESGTELLVPNFRKVGYGEPIFEKGVQDSIESGLEFNALKISGFWLMNEKNQGVVTEILERVKEASKQEGSHFTTQKTPMREGRRGKMVPAGKPVEMQDSEMLLNLESTLEDDAYGAPFTMVLPLKSPMVIE